MHILLIAMAMSIEHLTILTFQKCSSCQLLFSDIVKFLFLLFLGPTFCCGARLNWNQTYSTRSECICAIVTMVFRLCIIASNCEKCAEVAKSYMPLATEFENLHASGHSIDCLGSSSRQRWCKKLRSHVWWRTIWWRCARVGFYQPSVFDANTHVYQSSYTTYVRLPLY